GRRGPEGTARKDTRRRSPVRHLRPVETAPRTADRLGPRPERRGAAQHPPVRRSRGAPVKTEDQLEERPGEGPGAERVRDPGAAYPPASHARRDAEGESAGERRMKTLHEAIDDAMRAAIKNYDRGDTTPPVALLWPDPAGEWQPVATLLREE